MFDGHEPYLGCISLKKGKKYLVASTFRIKVQFIKIYWINFILYSYGVCTMPFHSESIWLTKSNSFAPAKPGWLQLCNMTKVCLLISRGWGERFSGMRRPGFKEPLSCNFVIIMGPWGSLLIFMKLFLTLNMGVIKPTLHSFCKSVLILKALGKSWSLLTWSTCFF